MSDTQRLLDFCEAELAKRDALIHSEWVLHRARRAKILTAVSRMTSMERLEFYTDYAKDPVGWINDFAVICDPRANKSANIPFILRPKQVEFIEVFLAGDAKKFKGGVLEKSREEGMTWLIAAYYIHQWIYKTGWAGLVASRKKELVDIKGDPSTIMEKMRFVIDNLPPFMVPSGYVRDKHALLAKITNPENGNIIRGEAGDNIGRGGRYTISFVDEAAHVENLGSIMLSLSQASDLKLFGGTPNGMANEFYELRQSGRLPIHVFGWWDNGDKNWEVEFEGKMIRPWYEHKKITAETALTVAQEIDIDYKASVPRILIPNEWIQAARLWEPVTLASWSSHQSRAGLDLSEEVGNNSPDKDKTVYVQVKGPKVAIVKRLTGEGIDSQVVELAKTGKVKVLNYDAVGVGSYIPNCIKNLEKAGGRKFSFQLQAIKNGNKPTGGRLSDSDVYNRERFVNLGAELWWRMRRMFECTYQLVNGIHPHPEEDCISLKNVDSYALDELCRQLGYPVYNFVNNKIRVDKKGHDGTARSPDMAEALMYAYAPDKKAFEAVKSKVVSSF